MNDGVPLKVPHSFLKAMKRQVVFIFVALSLLITVSAAGKSKTVSVTFYHTADIHEHSVPLVRIAGFIEARKQESQNVLFVDSGDWCNKGDLTALQTRGEAIAAMLGTCKYDAMIPGNHDYSFGTKQLAELIDRFSLPVVAANCVWQNDTQPKNAVPYRLFELDGVTVAIIGTATPIWAQEFDTLLEIRPMPGSLHDVVAKLKERADIIVLLTHVGVWEDEKLAQALPDVDIIFGGHDHMRYDELRFAPNTDTVIRHSGAMGQFIGELTITWNGKKIADRKLRLVRITDQLPESSTVAAIREKYLSEATVGVEAIVK
jgi:2',3'-cyclic-nucleotide 2'-phosphodiesterase (5'-nucleotidase family)